DSIRLTRSKRSPGPRAPGNRRDIFDIPGSPDRTACERTSRWRTRVDADRLPQLRARAALKIRRLASACFGRQVQSGSRAEQGTDLRAVPGVLRAPIELWPRSP